MPDPKLPATLAIGPHVFTVDAGEEVRQRLEDDGSRGDTRADRALIQIAHTLPPSIAAEVLVHEALHAAWAQTPLKLRFEADQQEEIITALAPLILGLVRHNPELVAFLVGT